jgi:hypothetical protein
MDWGFIDIFKRADFNSLMVAVAITGWIMYYFQIENIIFGLASIASIYCIIRFVVFCYQRFVRIRSIKKANKQEQLAKEQEEKRYEENRKIEISRMFDGLSDSNKFILASILINGKKDKYYDNVYHFQKYSKESLDLEMAQSISVIYRDRIGSGQACISIRDYQDTVVATIDPFLCDLIKQHIEKNKAQ